MEDLGGSASVQSASSAAYSAARTDLDRGKFMRVAPLPVTSS